MALLQRTLKSSLESIFTNPPDSAEGCAEAWANAISRYSMTVVPPSSTLGPAIESLRIALAIIFNNQSVYTTSDLENAFSLFASVLAPGMLPAFTSTPPVGLVGFEDLAVVETHSQAADNFSQKIHAWMTTGLATSVAPPFSTVNWS